MVTLPTAAHPNPFVRLMPHLPWCPPTDEDAGSRAIAEKVWGLADIQAVAEQQVSHKDATLLSAVTTDCIADMQKLQLDAVAVAHRLLQLTPGHYLNSAWCKRSRAAGVIVKEEQLWLPCDAYSLRQHETVQTTGWEGLVEYYFKLCLTPTRAIVLLVSVHI